MPRKRRQSLVQTCQYFREFLTKLKNGGLNDMSNQSTDEINKMKNDMSDFLQTKQGDNVENKVKITKMNDRYTQNSKKDESKGAISKKKYVEDKSKIEENATDFSFSVTDSSTLNSEESDNKSSDDNSTTSSNKSVIQKKKRRKDKEE